MTILPANLPALPILVFILGFAFALVPTIGPFVAVLLLFGQAFAFQRTDALWLLAAALAAIPAVTQHGLAGIVHGAGPVVAAWIVYRAFSYLPAIRLEQRYRALSIGLIVGLSVTVLLGWLQNTELTIPGRTIAQSIVWQSSPALYGHTILALGCAISLLVPFIRLRIAALALAAFGILVSGSREAGLAWVVFALLLPLLDREMQPDNRRARYYSLIGGVLVIMAILGGLLGWGRVGFLVDLVPITSREVNLIQNSEHPDSDIWLSHGVSASGAEVALDDQILTRIDVYKDQPEFWVRLQQVVDINHESAYTVSAWMRGNDALVRPGIQGWGELGDGQTFSLTGSLVEGDWRTNVSGPGTLLGAGTEDHGEGWTRNWITFRYEGESPVLNLFVGLTPDNRNVAGTRASFAGFQFEEAEAMSPYVAGSAVRGVSLGAGRLPFWQAAWSGFTESPLIGNTQAFTAHYLEQGQQRTRVQELPAHAHNFPLHILYSYGALGLLAVAVFILALAWPAWNRSDTPSLLLLAVVLLANIFDTTLFTGGVLYPVAAALGWRFSALDDTSQREEHRVSQFLSGGGLAIASLAAPVVAAALLTVLTMVLPATREVSAAIRELFSQPNFYYACLLWPAFIWREGLLPGYGISAPQQLRKQVGASLIAGLGFVAVALFWNQPSVGIALAIALLSTFVLPVLHALMRRLLARTGAWGEDVVVLGAGRGGTRVVGSLTGNPLSGLRPVAIFDDDQDKVGTDIHGVSVLGRIEQSVAYANAKGINHAIIAIPTMSPELVGHFMDTTGRKFRRVQFIPDLPGLPAEDVAASNLDGMLAIEFNNGLFSASNQIGKRLMDLLGSIVALVLLALPLLAIYILIRFDSPGGGFHRGERIGKDGKTFACLKFRTMYKNADEVLSGLLAEDPAMREEYETYHKLENDPRITRVGSFLRKYSLDELLQLVNVLRSEMSLVGARPYLTREARAMGEYATVILQAKPGITGLWQVSGRNELSFQERLELESHYVRNWTIWWDLIIMAQTVDALMSRRGAK